jgi:hypothetical protein
MRSSRLSGSTRIMSALHPTGLQEGCTGTMTAPRTALHNRPDQGGCWSWRPDSNRDRLFTRQARIVHGVLARAVLAAQVGGVVQPVRSCRAE